MSFSFFTSCSLLFYIVFLAPLRLHCVHLFPSPPTSFPSGFLLLLCSVLRGKEMGFAMNFRVFASAILVVVVVHFASANGQAIAAPTPAPAPAPEHVNLTDLLSVAGPFHTFLGYLQSTKVIETFQNQANNTDEGITLFVPKDEAFASLKNPSISNLTQDQLKSLCLFHALPHYYKLADFTNLSQRSPIPTFAGGQYSLNFTDHSGTVHVDSGWTKTKVISAVRATDPVAVYETDKVLLPEAIFGTDIPPTPAPAPAPVPDTAPAADSPSERGGSESSSQNSSPSSSHRVLISGKLSQLALAFVGGLFIFL